jgi:DHA2 family multidrug resistance protein-like MFS transporter
MSGGLVLAAIGFGMLTQIRGEGGLAILVSAFVIMSVGLSATMTVTTDLIVGVAPPERAGAASAISETSSELGLALGIATVGSLGTAVYRRDIARSMPSDIPAEAADAARDTLGNALAVAARLSGQLGAELVDAARAAFTHALQITALTGAVMVMGLSVLVFVVLGRLEPRSSNG